MIVLDSNVLSELMCPSPAKAVTRWVSLQPAATLYATAITRAEILYGIFLLPAGRRRKTIEELAMAMFQEDFSGRVLPFDRLRNRGRRSLALTASAESERRREQRGQEEPALHRRIL